MDTNDVNFGDPELTNLDWKQYRSEFRPMPPDMNPEGKRCGQMVMGSKYLLPSGRVVSFTPNHLENEYRLDFEIVDNRDADAKVQPVPDKLVFIKNWLYTSCKRVANYFHPDPDDQDFSDGMRCGVCCGKEELPPDRSTLTIEMLEAKLDESLRQRQADRKEKR